MSVAACTVIARNYVAHARVLARSFRRHHPDARFFALVVDEDGTLQPSEEPFEILRLRDLPPEDWTALAFRYSALELCTAVKPFLLRYLLAEGRMESVIYLDPDILVYQPLDPLWERLRGCSALLTPHITSPIADGAQPGELAFLQCGVFNLGFAGVSPRAIPLLDWWKDRCRTQCVHSVSEGLFVDQKWMDLAPVLFEGVEVVREPEYNAAYWNLQERRIEAGPPPRVNGRPLRFFHFSGFDPEKPNVVSKHQTRFSMRDVGDARALFGEYARKLFSEGYRRVARRPYGFDRFSNGVLVAPAVRALYRSLGDEAAAFGDPFDASHARTYFAWMRGDDGGGRTPLESYLLEAYLPRHRPDVAVRAEQWLRDGGRVDLQLDASLLQSDPVAPRAPANPVAASCLVCRMMPLIDRLGGRASLRGVAAQVIGAKDARDASATRRLLLGLARRTLRPCGRHRVFGPPVKPRRRSVMRGRGVNLAGYLTCESGVGEAARLMAHALEAAEIPHALLNYGGAARLRQLDTTIRRYAPEALYDTNLVHVNADQVGPFCEDQGDEFFAGRASVGYWLWELDEFPDAWRAALAPFREIWAPTEFVARAIRAKSSLPVHVVPLPFVRRAEPAVPAPVQVARDRFVFLFMFDFLSFVERKNPFAVIEAFRRVRAREPAAHLVLKCANGDSDPQAYARLRRETAEPGITLIDRYLSRDEITALVRRCDAYVSLHRAEGLGLTLAEAMTEGKPVVATAYSGNMDFMSEATARLVPYRLVPIERDLGPYRAGNRWADPDVATAAEAMLWCVRSPDAARAMGARGRESLTGRFSPETCGRAVVDRLRSVHGETAAARA